MGTTNTPNLALPSTPTRIVGGVCRREATRIWISTAESEARINLMKKLLKEGRGLNELEEFHINLAGKFKSKKFKNLADKNTGVHSAVISPAM